MEVVFLTKKESNRLQKEAFLKLSKAERVLQFFKLSEEIQQLFPTKHKRKNTDNFIIDLSK